MRRGRNGYARFALRNRRRRWNRGALARGRLLLLTSLLLGRLAFNAVGASGRAGRRRQCVAFGWEWLGSAPLWLGMTLLAILMWRLAHAPIVMAGPTQAKSGGVGVDRPQDVGPGAGRLGLENLSWPLRIDAVGVWLVGELGQFVLIGWSLASRRSAWAWNPFVGHRWLHRTRSDLPGVDLVAGSELARDVVASAGPGTLATSVPRRAESFWLAAGGWQPTVLASAAGLAIVAAWALRDGLDSRLRRVHSSDVLILVAFTVLTACNRHLAIWLAPGGNLVYALSGVSGSHHPFTFAIFFGGRRRSAAQRSAICRNAGLRTVDSAFCLSPWAAGARRQGPLVDANGRPATAVGAQAVHEHGWG